MPSRANHFMAERVRELLENLARWPGWGSGTSSRSTLAWLDDFVANKRVGDYHASIPVMGGEAADAQRALMRMPYLLGRVLLAHYIERGRVDVKIEAINKSLKPSERLSRRTYFRYLERSHPVFMEQFKAVRQEAGIAEAANVKSASDHAGASVARRHRLVVSPKLTLKAPEKPSENKT